MILWIVLLVVLYLIWILLFKGLLWKILLFFGGWVGIYVLLRANLPDSLHTAVTIAGHDLSWAFVVPSVICILCLANTKG
jgi:hypothetical protein